MRCVALGLVATAMCLGVGCGEDDKPITGQWRGELTEKRSGVATGERFDIDLSITSLDKDANPAATVAYPGLGSEAGCSGEWKYKGNSGPQYFFKERITKGRNSQCFGSGDVKLVRQNPNRLYYEWSSGQNSSTGYIGRAD